MTAGKALRVIMADDSAPVRGRMAALLREIDHVEVVSEAADAPQAIDELRRLRPDVIVLDLCMPGGNGLEVLDRIREEELRTVAVVLTGHSEPEYEDLALRAGAAAFFDKNRDFLKVVDFVRDLARFSSSGGDS